MPVRIYVAGGCNPETRKDKTMTTIARRMTGADAYRARRSMETRPGEWVELPTTAKDPQHYVWRARAGQIKAFPPAEFEFELIDGRPMGRTRKYA